MENTSEILCKDTILFDHNVFAQMRVDAWIASRITLNTNNKGKNHQVRVGPFSSRICVGSSRGLTKRIKILFNLKILIEACESVAIVKC
ncbi:hypothetical protein GOP47_0008057 [Adiantum capillus-veneris]|uniref:Uncharacterized protein n=1 Tax=Adiantum capillus-veneris TaxID=13818 RepID=A0A9D4UYB2_ADICA|nr:hypothetical protein GOP47_0008057 [Adiantum capillus-veneris]